VSKGADGRGGAFTSSVAIVRRLTSPTLLVAAVVLALVAASCSSSSDVSSVEANESGSTIDTSDDTASTEPDTTVSDTTEPDTTEPGTSAPADPGSLDWQACDDQPTPGVDLECATLAVPLDHAVPDGDTIDIALARVPANGDPDERIGSLVFNPGGPGGSGIDFLTSAVAVMPTEITAVFDLVGFDPRGVGASTAVDCDVQVDDNIALLEPGDDAGWQALLDDANGIVDDCPADALALAPYVGTNNAARDLDLIRAALGDDQLSYVGFSYGTRLGATYAELFPANVRALVLDGGVKPSDDGAELDREQGLGFDKALENFAAACDADTDCLLQELGPTLDVYAGLVAEIAAAGTLPTDDPERVLTPGELQLGVAAALYSKDAWPFLAEALYLADTVQDGTLLQILGDGLVGRQPDGTYDNSNEANTFINCADDPRRPDADTQRTQADEAAAPSKWFDDFLRASTGCLGITDPIDPLTIGPADGAAPILVIGNSGDPATPYEWSVALAESLTSAVLYTVEAEGHTAFLSVDCVEPVVVSYLVDLEMPEPDSSCSDNATADFFVPKGESDVDLIIALFDCLRENGADVPEITTADVLADPSGETLFGDLDTNSAEFAAAAEQCQDIIDQL
jgi:pimeloyl-ACP methyl ester carboxylesterase